MQRKLRLSCALLLFLLPFAVVQATQGYPADVDTSVVYPMDPIVVTGSRVEVARSNVPFTVSVVSEFEIRQSGESALLPVISERVPGVFVTERGVTGFGVASGAAGNITVRGVGGSPNTEVLILIDGHPQFMGIFGHPLPDAYVSTDAERIEVLRGPGSILYGTGAMGGVINIITKKQHRDGLTLRARASGGSYDTQKYSGTAGYKMKGLSLFGSVNHDQTAGHRDNSDFDITNGYLKMGYALSKQLRLTVDGNLARFKAYDPGPQSAPYVDEEHWVDIDRGKVAISIENKTEKLEGACKFFYNFGEHKIYDGFHSEDTNAGIMLYQGLRLFPNNVLTVGVDYKEYGGKAENTAAAMDFGDHSVDELGVYTSVQHTLLQKLILNGGLRLENHSVYGNEVVPQVGVAFHVTPVTTIKGSVSKGFRSPTIRELYLFPPANPDLKPERMWNYELGIMRSWFDQRLSAELTGFLAQGENLIRTEGQYPNVQNRNTGEFRHRGMELEGRYRLSSNLRFTGNYSYLDMDDPLTSAPEHQLFAEATYTRGLFSLSADVQHVGTLYTLISDDGNEVQDYTVFNARTTVRPTSFLEIFVAGENLTDEEYEINYDYPMPTATVFAGMNFRFAVR